MKMLNETEMSLVNGGFICYTPPMKKLRAEIDAKRAHEKWLKWVNQEKQKLQGIADIRMRAAEDALKAAMRINRAEMNIKAAQSAAMGLD